MNDQQPTSRTIGYMHADPGEWTVGEYHYTSLEDNRAFKDLLARHGLEFAANLTCEHCEFDPATANVWVRPDETLELATATDPIRDDEEPGYLSYTTVAGEFAFAKQLWDDIAEMCTYNKGMFRPLAPVNTATDDIPDSNWPERTADQEGYRDPGYEPEAGGLVDGDDSRPEVAIPEGGTLESYSGMQATIVTTSDDVVTVHGDGVTRELDREAIEREIRAGRTTVVDQEYGINE